MTRPTQWCDMCESTVYSNGVHSCYNAKAVRAQRERERALTVKERDVIEKAEAIYWWDEPADIPHWQWDELTAAVRALTTARQGEGC